MAHHGHYAPVPDEQKSPRYHHKDVRALRKILEDAEIETDHHLEGKLLKWKHPKHHDMDLLVPNKFVTQLREQDFSKDEQIFILSRMLEECRRAF